MNFSTPGFPVLHYLPERKWSHSVTSDSAIPRTVAYQVTPSMGFSRQEYWSGLPFLSLGDLPNSGIEPGSPALQTDALPSEPPGKPISRSLLKLRSIESMMPCNHLILSPPSPPALNHAQHQGLFQWGGFLHQLAKVLELQYQSFQWIFRVDFL